MSYITLSVLLASCSILCFLEVQVVGGVVICDEEHEFMCPVGNKCIPKAKVCNFVEDCIGGADEMQCGSCEFHLQTPEECGLSLKSDKEVSWFRVEPIEEEVKNPIFLEGKEPLNYIETNLNATMKQYIYRQRDRINHNYKPRILFPHLKPTNNDKCQLVIHMRITELGEQVVDSILEDATWPQVTLLIIEPKQSDGSIKGRANRRYTSLDLQVKKESAGKRGEWLTYKVALGAHETSWTMELVVEALIKSSLVQISSIQYSDCMPTGKGIDMFTEDPLSDNIICESGLFKCEISGLCIDESLICDYGHDCGENDDSDEEYCDDYLGRCDFEDESLCDWSLSGNKTWIYATALNEDQAFYGSALAKPTTDHTFESKTLGGHYLLLNSSQLRMFTMYNLMGPHVSLQLEADDCYFRFWASTPQELSSKGITSPYMNIGRAHISPDRLFNHSSPTDWHRYQVRLLSRSNIEESNIAVLQVGFGNFGADLRSFLDSNGYLALDDFSFTPGCHLKLHGPAIQEVCGDQEFFCHIGSSFTGAQCIPLVNYCDFKNDCGLDGSLSWLAEDERDCPHECKYQNNETCSSIQVQDGLSKRLDGTFRVNDQVNEAFNWSLKLEETSGHLLIESQSDKYLAKYKSHLARSTNLKDISDPQSLKSMLGIEPNSKLMRNMRNLIIYLPTFTESHANCTFQLTYKWANHTNNVHASIYIDSESKTHSYLLKRLIPNDESRSSAQTITFGLGHQQYPFKLFIDVYFVDNLLNLLPHQGALSIFSYKFVNCPFFFGLINKRIEFETGNDQLDDDDDNMEATDYLDYQYSSSASFVNTTCEKDYFQCHQPIVCIPEELVCDMQRDCQGGADERDCSSKGWIQYDFDGANDDPAGLAPNWINLLETDSSSSKFIWSPTNGGLTKYRNSYSTGPPYDHTRSDFSGKYLFASGGNGIQITKSASLRSPYFNLTSANCHRVVFYLYLYGDHLNKFQVLFSTTSNEETLIYELSNINPLDRWQRISLSLVELTNSSKLEEFSLIFRAFSGNSSSDLIALDDISFGPSCKLSLSDNTNNNNDDHDYKEATGNDEMSWIKVIVIFLIFGAFVMVSIGCQAKNVLNLTSPLAGINGNKNSHDNNLTASGYMMEHSMEDLGIESSFNHNPSNTNQSYDEQHRF